MSKQKVIVAVVAIIVVIAYHSAQQKKIDQLKQRVTLVERIISIYLSPPEFPAQPNGSNVVVELPAK